MTVTTIRGLDFKAGAPIQVEIKAPDGRTLVLAGVSEIALSQTPNGCIRAVMTSADAESSFKAREEAHRKCHQMLSGHGQVQKPETSHHDDVVLSWQGQSASTPADAVIAANGHGQQGKPQDAGHSQPWNGLSPSSPYSVTGETGIAAQQTPITPFDIGPVDLSFEDSQFETLPDPSMVASAANTSTENLEHAVAEGFMFDPAKALPVCEPQKEPTPEKCEFQRIADAITEKPLASLHR